MTDTHTKQLTFIVGALKGLHLAIGRQGIATGNDLTVDQLEMIKDIVLDIVEKSGQYAS